MPDVGLTDGVVGSAPRRHHNRTGANPHNFDGGIMDKSSQLSTRRYEPPVLRTLGTVAQLTQTFDKRWHGSDGWQFIGINIPVHNVSP